MTFQAPARGCGVPGRLNRYCGLIEAEGERSGKPQGDFSKEGLTETLCTPVEADHRSLGLGENAGIIKSSPWPKEKILTESILDRWSSYLCLNTTSGPLRQSTLLLNSSYC